MNRSGREQLLVLLGGRERGEDDWRLLLGRGGFALVGADPGALLVEAVRKSLTECHLARIRRSPEKGLVPDGV